MLGLLVLLAAAIGAVAAASSVVRGAAAVAAARCFCGVRIGGRCCGAAAVRLVRRVLFWRRGWCACLRCSSCRSLRCAAAGVSLLLRRRRPSRRLCRTWWLKQSILRGSTCRECLHRAGAPCALMSACHDLLAQRWCMMPATELHTRKSEVHSRARRSPMRMEVRA